MGVAPPPGERLRVAHLSRGENRSDDRRSPIHMSCDDPTPRLKSGVRRCSLIGRLFSSEGFQSISERPRTPSNFGGLPYRLPYEFTKQAS
jgi:hypothetical protein